MHTTRRFFILAVALTLVTGCASAGEGGSGAGSRQNTITRDEIAESGLINMEDVITRLRPQYLRGRGQSSIRQADVVAIYMDGSSLGGPEALRTVMANAVERVEFVSGPETGYRFGMNHPAGVINIITR